MSFLFLSLLATIGIFIIFKVAHLRKIPIFKVVSINYLFCTLAGVLFHFEKFKDPPINPDFSWMPFSIILGALFIFSFFLVGKTTAEFGLSITSISTKISLIIPSLLSIFLFNSADLNFFMIAALIISVPSIILASYKKTEKKEKSLLAYLPLALFLLSGIIDGGINTLSFYFSDYDSFIFFPVSIFFFAALFGIIYNLITRERIEEWKSFNLWIAGASLGIVNYFSIEFLIKGLQNFNNNGALVYPFLNVGVIFFSSVFGLSLFKEKLSPRNKFGLIMAIVCLVFLVLSASPIS